MFLRQLTRADCMKKRFIYKCIYNRWVRRKAYSFWDIFFYKWLYKIHVSQTFGTWLLTQHRWENVYTTWKWHKLKMFQSTHVYFTLLNDGCVRFLRIFLRKISVSVVYNISHIPSKDISHKSVFTVYRLSRNQRSLLEMHNNTPRQYVHGLYFSRIYLKCNIFCSKMTEINCVIIYFFTICLYIYKKFKRFLLYIQYKQFFND